MRVPVLCGRFRVPRSIVLCSALGFVVGAGGLRAADCNGNGVDDGVDVAEGTSEDCNGNALPDECELAPASLAPAGEPRQVPSIPRVLSSADVDLDGDRDIVCGSDSARGESAIAVLRGTGDGSFAEPLLVDSLGNLEDMALGDLDGDRFPDIATANEEFLQVLLADGRGGFEEPLRVELDGGDARALELGDLSGDGALDLVATDGAGDQVLVFPGDGGGGLGPPRAFPSGEDPQGLALEDFDGDGALDVAVWNRGTNDVTVFLGDGDGMLRPTEPLDLPGRRTHGIVAFDAGTDGFPDLGAVSTSGVVVFRGLGDGSFEAAGTYPANGALIASADANDDGHADLVVGGGRTEIAVRLNDGRGGFAVSSSIRVQRLPSDLEPVDLDGDGIVELAALQSADSSVVVFGQGTGSLAGYEMERVQVRLTGCADARGCRPHSGAAADFDGDGDLDVVTCITHPGTFGIVENDGDGLDFAGSVVFGGKHPQSVAAGDVDGDGDLDAVTCDNLDHNLYVHLNPGAGLGFSRPQRFRVGTSPIHVQLADLDADGHLDAGTANESSNNLTILYGDGTGRFGSRSNLRARGAPKAIAFGDMDGNGVLDVAAANSRSPYVSVYLGEEGRAFGPRADYRLRSSPNHVAAGDLDGDGVLDLVAAVPGTRGCAVLPGAGDGTFEEPRDIALGARPYSVIAVDFTGDGALDLVTGNEASSSVTIAPGLGDGTFAAARQFRAGTGVRFVFPGDLDGDGDIDLATADREGHTVTLLFQRSEREQPDFLSEICTPAEFHALSRLDRSGGRSERLVKYLLPAGDAPDALPATFQNTSRHELHREFLQSVFPDRFPTLSPEEYDELAGRRATREYFAGALARKHVLEADTLVGFEGATAPDRVFGFSVFADFSDPGEALRPDEVRAIRSRLAEVFHLEPLVYAPGSRPAFDAARRWDDPGFPILLRDTSSALAFEPYTQGVGFGRVRIFDETEFLLASLQGRLGFQDILVLDFSPRDIEGVVSGVITARVQDELSHVAIRTARRGTPNAFVREATDVFAPWEDRLVRLEVGRSEFRVRPADEAEAKRWWEASRPELSSMPSVDREFSEVSSLDEVLAQERGGADIIARFGGKASNLARLRGALEGPFERFRERGLAVPMSHYLEFLRTNRMPSAFGEEREVTYQEYLGELFASTEFHSDSRFRFRALRDLRASMREQSEVSGELVQTLAERIEGVFGATTRVRFRSSSNIEDAVEFNGAGLYDSTSACAADDLDDNEFGPSLCDVGREDERGIARALRRVWASLWNFRAYEERAFYGVPDEVAAMGILVSRAFPDERANGVAFTGNPAVPGDNRFVIVAQLGEVSVVDPPPGVTAEKTVLEIEDGSVENILRARRSSLVSPGQVVLSRETLEELGALMAHVEENLPVDSGEHPPEDVLLDLEFKVEEGGSLAVKQVRPFLRATPRRDSPTFELALAGGATLCGGFLPGRGPRREYELKSELRLVSGSLPLPSRLDVFPSRLVEELRVGPERELAVPRSEGVFRVTAFRRGDGRATHSFEYEQTFDLSGDRVLTITASGFDFEEVDGQAVEASRALRDFGELFVRGRFEGGEPDSDISYGSCGHEGLPLWHIRAELADGSTLELEERFRFEPQTTTPASVAGAELDLRGEQAEVRDYWRLVYSAARHNDRVRYWVVLDPALALEGLEEEVRAVDLTTPQASHDVEGSARYLDEDFEPLAEIELTGFEREVTGDALARFRRGDMFADGAVELSDAIQLLNHLFHARRAPACAKAADTNDDGAVDLDDAVQLLDHLFRGAGPLPAPSGVCGTDPSADELACEAFASCE